MWTDVDRWPSFVEGYARRVELYPDWPSPGARVVWESNPEGRGRVTETVTAHSSDRFATQVYEERLMGTQTFRVAPSSDGSEVALGIEYELTSHGPLSGLADLLFIRRALRDSLRRTLYRFSLEAEEEAGLR